VTGSHDDQVRVDWTTGEPVIIVSHCATCNHRWYLPRDACPTCGGARIRRFGAAGAGAVAAVTIVHRAAEGTPEADGPVGIALVDLDEGVRVMGRCSINVLIGQRVRVSFAPVPWFEGAEL
jgi:uncharacterized OB-fold protein